MFYFHSLIFQGYKRTLYYADIWDIREEDSSETIVENFEDKWENELQRCGYTREAVVNK